MEGQISDCKIKDIATGLAISLNVTYEVSCQAEQAVKVVQALYDGPHPGAVLEELISRWLQAFARRQKHESNPFIRGYFHGLKKQAEDELNRRAKEEIGLMLEARLSLRDVDKIKPVQIHSQFFPVRVKDYSEELSLKIAEAMLQVNEDNKIYIVTTNEQDSQLLQLLQQKMGVFLRENVTLHEFVYQLNSQLRDKLVTYLNDHFLLYRGRKISYLALDSNEIRSLRPEESLQFEYNDNAVKVKNCPTPISMTHTVVMNLNNIGKYKAAKIDDLETWLESKLKKITRTILLGKEYAELMLSETGEQIKNELEAEVKSIGYSVKHLVSKPPELIDLELKGIHFDDSVECTTKDTRIQSQLSISVHAEIGKINLLKKFLNPHKNIVEEIKERIFQEIKQRVRKIEPETFYLKFHTIEQVLIDGISKTLPELGLKEKSVTVDQDKKHDLFFVCFDELAKELYDYEVIFPISDENEEPLKLIGSFRVLNVDWKNEQGWDKFQRQATHHNPKEIQKKITETFERNIRTNLRTQDIYIIRQANNEVENPEEIESIIIEIAKIIQNLLNQSMKKFGLLGQIENAPLSLTPSDELIEERHLLSKEEHLDTLKTKSEVVKESNKQSLSMAKELLQKRAKYTAEGYENDDPALKNINQQIKTLGIEMPSYSKHKTHSQPKPNSYKSRLDYLKKKTQHLSSEQPTKRLEKDTKEEDNE
ncbi:MAG: hypothetical protein KAI83_17440 [Thiomargarita sp.]|nr:hypothetical protein [Thiomargarita sp.]